MNNHSRTIIATVQTRLDSLKRISLEGMPVAQEIAQECINYLELVLKIEEQIEQLNQTSKEVFG